MAVPYKFCAIPPVGCTAFKNSTAFFFKPFPILTYGAYSACLMDARDIYPEQTELNPEICPSERRMNTFRLFRTIDIQIYNGRSFCCKSSKIKLLHLYRCNNIIKRIYNKVNSFCTCMGAKIIGRILYNEQGNRKYDRK